MKTDTHPLVILSNTRPENYRNHAALVPLLSGALLASNYSRLHAHDAFYIRQLNATSSARAHATDTTLLSSYLFLLCFWILRVSTLGPSRPLISNTITEPVILSFLLPARNRGYCLGDSGARLKSQGINFSLPFLPILSNPFITIRRYVKRRESTEFILNYTVRSCVIPAN